MAWHWLFWMGWVLAQHASGSIIQLIPECQGAAVGQGGGGSVIFVPAVAYPNFLRINVPKPAIIWAVWTFFLAVAWGSGGSFLSNSIALGLKSAANLGSGFQRLLVTFWGQLGVQFGAYFGHNFRIHFRVLVWHILNLMSLLCLLGPVSRPQQRQNQDMARPEANKTCRTTTM